MTTIHIQSIEEWFDSTAIIPLLIAGPCVESPEQMLETAQKIKKYAPVSFTSRRRLETTHQTGFFLKELAAKPCDGSLMRVKKPRLLPQ